MDPGRIRLKGSRSKSERNRITSVDCFMIAYAVVQVCRLGTRRGQQDF